MNSLSSKIDQQRIWLATGLVCAFIACVLLLFFQKIPDVNKDLITYMIGQLSGMATMALGFYFTNKAGQDEADAEKTANTGKMADAIKATAEAATSVASPSIAAEKAALATADAAKERAEDFVPTKVDPDEELFNERDK